MRENTSSKPEAILPVSTYPANTSDVISADLGLAFLCGLMNNKIISWAMGVIWNNFSISDGVQPDMTCHGPPSWHNDHFQSSKETIIS